MITVVIPTHNPNPHRFKRALDGLRAQTLLRDRWNLVVVDNASSDRVQVDAQDVNIQVVREERIGLTNARLCGLANATGEIVVFVDDDNVLCPEYLDFVEKITQRLPRVGALGGKSIPDWEQPQRLPSWIGEFSENLALRDLGDEDLISEFGEGDVPLYPPFSPIGAGMAVRKEAIQGWVQSTKNGTGITDRCGNSLSSGGDNDIVLYCLKAGYAVGYFPKLNLRHIIPSDRLTVNYHARLSQAMMRSWVGVLDRHSMSPWTAIKPSSSGIRKAKAFFRMAAWSSPQARIRWRAACGLIDGQADMSRARRES